MANPFEITPVNPLQALMMGQQGYDRGRKTVQDSALSEAGRLYAAGDVKGAQALAAQGGSLQALMGFAGLQNSDRDYQRALANDTRSQGNTEAQLALQRQQIAATAGNTAASQALARAQFAFQQEQGNRPEIREVTGQNGDKSLVLVDRKDPSKVQPVTVPGQTGEKNNPFLAGGNMNEGQSNAALYADRAMKAERVLSGAGVSSTGASATERGRAAVPLVGNFLASENFQKFDQARRDFTAAILRKESGAAIGKDEYANADRQYFPQPGDSASVIEQKRQNRISAIKGIGAAAGTGYKPSTTLDAQGNVIDRGQPQQAAQPSALPPLPPGFVVQQ